MRKYKMIIGGGDSNDLGVYDQIAAAVRKNGFDVMGMHYLAEGTREQEEVDLDGAWLRFSAHCPSLSKAAETELINGVYSKEHIEKNAYLAREKSKILAKYDLGGTCWILEPMWLPESFYAKYPETRGARCDNPCLALDDYYSPCLDDAKVLGHYREAMRKFLEIAPRFRLLTLGTNDSGAGICWCSGLYPGVNGPEHCKNVKMGDRMRGWFDALLAGADDAGRPLDINFIPVHFSRSETKDTVEKCPKRATLGRDGNYPDIYKHLKRRGLERIGVASASLVGWFLSPMGETVFPYATLESTQALAESDATIASLGGISEPILGIDTVGTMALLSGFRKPPKSSTDIEKRVLAIAKEHVGPRLATALVSAWRQSDHALRLFSAATHGDTNHMLHPQYSVIGDRWLIRPIVPDPTKIADADKEYYNRQRHHGRGHAEPDSFFIAESTKNYKIAELKWPVALLNDIDSRMARAVGILDKAMTKAAKEDELTRKRFILQYRRIKVERAIWRTQKNVLRGGSIIEYFTGPEKEEYWHVIRKDESFYEPATYRRLFLEMMDDEIANCREMIQLMRESDVKLFVTGDKEDTFVLPHNLDELLEKKIALMEAHKGDIDVLFPNCPPETFADPTYEWADKRFKGQRR